MSLSQSPGGRGPELPPAGWHTDPSGKHHLRYWDGSKWTEHVFTDGQQTTDVAAVSPGPIETHGGSNESGGKIPLFGARGKARELTEEVKRLRAELDRLRPLGVLSVDELERRRDSLTQEITGQEAKLEQDRAEAEQKVRDDLAELTNERDARSSRLEQLRAELVVTEEAAVLQEVGLYEYRHPLDDAVAYQAELKRLRDRIKTMARKDGGAILASTDWSVEGSAARGRTMVREYSKLMLRAYNAEADNLVRGLKPYKLSTAIDRLTKAASTIEKLGKTMNIRISDAYHGLRVRELELTADYLEKKAEEKEREREEKARLQEERRAQQEMERERARLEKERQHHENALKALVVKGDEEAAARLRKQLGDIDRKIEEVDYRAANVRAGYVYVISNMGSLGDNIVKIGMTRRLDPYDRVRELGDASVPFKFDVHTIFFSEDAVGIEAKLHERLADRRVNAVNRRREFFYATPHEVKEHLMDLTGEILEYEELPEAIEYRQSVTEGQLAHQP